MKNKSTTLFHVLIVASLLTACAHTHQPAGANTASAEVTAAKINHSPEGARLNSIIDRYVQDLKRLDAFNAPYYNMEELLSSFGDYASPDFFTREKALYANALAVSKGIDANKLDANEKWLYQMFQADMDDHLKSYSFPNEYLEFNQMENRLHSYLDDSSQDLTSFPFDSVAHYKAFVERSKGFPAYIERQIALLKKGVENNTVLSCDVVNQVPNSYLPGLETTPEKNPFYRPILFMPKTFSNKDRDGLKTEFVEMIRDRIVPGFKKFDDFFQKEYKSKCWKGFGLGQRPNGKRWYRAQIKIATNLDKDAKSIHQLGLREVARLEREFSQIKKELGFKGSNQAFRKSLLTNQNFFFKSSADIFKAMSEVKTKVAERIPKYFSLIPKGDYTIVSTSNPEDAAGSYNEPTELVPYGKFMINTINLRAVPIYGVTTLSLHEASPGHHFQLALQFEEKDSLTEYQRKVFKSNSFVEGWALYAEYLGNEMGMFSDPMQRLGNRNDEMLRAVRLVVDTGIHHYGWSRSKAIQFMTEHLASDPGDISNEVNRYSVWPGQALGYKLGSLKILELRKRAEKALGQKFDIREFHRIVIGHGTLSLSVLETLINSWIQDTLAKST